MFQSFTSNHQSGGSKERLSRLRDSMKVASVDWFLVPHADEHQNEYLPERAERLAWLTGFTGSAGFALIGRETAYLFVDGRYTVQAKDQVDADSFELKDLISDTPTKFAKTVMNAGDKIGFDPWLITLAQHASWDKTAVEKKATLHECENLIDAIWHDQPDAPLGNAWNHEFEYSGRETADKLVDIRKKLNNEKADYLLLTDPASIAWTFNIRGNDIIHNPLTLSWAILSANDEKPHLFIDNHKLDDKSEIKLQGVSTLHPPSQLDEQLEKLAPENTFHCDPNLVAYKLGEILKSAGATLIEKRDPVVILRAVKNETELAGARAAHIRDGVALAKFLAWLDAQPHGTTDEIAAAKQLESLRSETALAMDSELKEISFDTISGAAANGAIVHYRVTEDTNAKLNEGTLYLVDSGGQYLDGTTDITRTVAIGKPPSQAVTDNTLVLKGHIAIARARFPKGTRGVDLDGLARMALWQAGKDFAHGTGHGIGSYLNVHEGPQSISRRGMEAFQPGMIVSNEPGYYKEGAYGIRIENLLIVTDPQEISGGDKPMLGFETITLCPIDHRLIDKNMLTAAELGWVNDYHIKVRDTLAPHMTGDDLEWLEAATKAL